MNIKTLNGIFENIKIDVDAYVIDYFCTSLSGTNAQEK